MKRLLALMLCVSMLSPGCAARMSSRNGMPAVDRQRPHLADQAVMADYIRQLPVGSRVRVVQANGKVMHAILIKNAGDPVVVQRRTRIPEAPIDLPIGDIVAMELEPNTSNPGRTVAISAAAAVGATLGVLMLLAAIFAD